MAQARRPDRPQAGRGPCAVQADLLTCYTLLNKPVEKPARWQYGETAPHAGVDCCPAFGCRKAAGIKVSKTGERSRKKKTDGAAAAAAMGAAAPLELIAANQLLGSRLVDEILLARLAADRCERLSDSQFGIEWLIQGQWRAAGQPEDDDFYGARWIGQAALQAVVGGGVFESMVRAYAKTIVDSALAPLDDEGEQGEQGEQDEVAGAAHGEDAAADDVEVCCRRCHCRPRHRHCPTHSHTCTPPCRCRSAKRCTSAPCCGRTSRCTWRSIS